MPREEMNMNKDLGWVISDPFSAEVVAIISRICPAPEFLEGLQSIASKFRALHQADIAAVGASQVRSNLRDLMKHANRLSSALEGADEQTREALVLANEEKSPNFEQLQHTVLKNLEALWSMATAAEQHCVKDRNSSLAEPFAARRLVELFERYSLPVIASSKGDAGRCLEIIFRAGGRSASTDIRNWLRVAIAG